MVTNIMVNTIISDNIPGEVGDSVPDLHLTSRLVVDLSPPHNASQLHSDPSPPELHEVNPYPTLVSVPLERNIIV